MMSEEMMINRPSIHPHHLLKTNDPLQYRCNACNTYGSGDHYRCNHCNFDLHNLCATFPDHHHSATHPAHPLRLVYRYSSAPTRLTCAVCDNGTDIPHLSYACASCDFNAHVLCAMLPAQVNHAADASGHPLSLARVDDGWLPVACAACGSNGCGGVRWCYGCGACGVYVHLECLDRPVRGELSRRSDVARFEERPPVPYWHQFQPPPPPPQWVGYGNHMPCYPPPAPPPPQWVGYGNHMPCYPPPAPPPPQWVGYGNHVPCYPPPLPPPPQQQPYGNDTIDVLLKFARIVVGAMSNITFGIDFLSVTDLLN